MRLSDVCRTLVKLIEFLRSSRNEAPAVSSEECLPGEHRHADFRGGSSNIPHLLRADVQL